MNSKIATFFRAKPCSSNHFSLDMLHEKGVNYTTLDAMSLFRVCVLKYQPIQREVITGL